jgi:uncharacterized membrane protein
LTFYSVKWQEFLFYTILQVLVTIIFVLIARKYTLREDRVAARERFSEAEEAEDIRKSRVLQPKAKE